MFEDLRREANERVPEKRAARPEPPPAAAVLALQRAAGNRAVAALLGRAPKPAGPVLQRKGRLSGAMTEIETKWEEFKGHTGDVEETLYFQFGPMLGEHTKAQGMTATKAKGGKGGLTYDPEKEHAINTAQGLLEWTKSASEGAERYYAEMRQSIGLFGGPGTWWQFGVSDLTQPDAFSLGGVSVESKRTTNVQSGGVDELIREARFQSVQRVNMPTGYPFTQWQIAIEIASDTAWPYTPTELNKHGLTPSQVPVMINNNPGLLPEPPTNRLAKRNLSPKKGKKTAAIPGAQAGKHELVVTWADSGRVWRVFL